MDNYVKGVKVIEIYDAANKELLVKYDDKHNIDKVISALNIKSWKETEKSIGMNPKYTIKFYCDTTNQDEEKDIKEITLYDALSTLKISRSSFYRRLSLYSSF